MSSYSEDCYGNAALRLQKLKNSYWPKPIAPQPSCGENKNNGSPVRHDSITNTNATILNDSPIILDDDGIPERVVLPPLLPTVTIPSRSPVVSRRCTRNSARLSGNDAADVPMLPPTRRGRKSKSLSQRPPRRNQPSPVAPATTVPAVPDPPPVVAALPSATTPTRGRGRARGGRAGSSQTGKGRGRGRRGNRSSRAGVLDAYVNMMSASNMMDSVIYSVGNTHEYEDTAENQPLFSSQGLTKTNNDVVLVGDADLSSSFDDENEELSVKVYWQSMEYVKFNIRRFQKLTQLFDFFSKRANVSRDNLLFTLGDKIIKAEDTPDSINYNIGLFIDGGIVNCSVADIVPGRSRKENKVRASGIMIKFQCQNVKKPFETNIERNKKFLTAMAKCAEHFELPIARLKFFFDGDPLGPSSTPADHDMEGGECVDVSIAS